MSQLFESGGQSIGASASALVLPMNIQDWFPLVLMVSSPCPRDPQESSPAPKYESISSLTLSLLYGPILHPYMTTGKTIALTIQTFVCKIMWSEVKVTQLCPTLCDPMDCIVHEILQARILEWVALPFSRGSSQPRDQTQVSHISGGLFTS